MNLARLLALAALALAACVAPSQHDPAAYGTVAVYYAPDDWASSYRDVFREELRVLDRLGPRFVEAATEAEATVVVRHWVSPDCAAAAARWTRGTRVVELDPVCLPGTLVLRTAFQHEVGHALGLAHVCRRAGDAPDCSPVGFGPALMNPFVVTGDAGPGFEEAYVGQVPHFEPSELDLAEFRRTRP